MSNQLSSSLSSDDNKIIEPSNQVRSSSSSSSDDEPVVRVFNHTNEIPTKRRCNWRCPHPHRPDVDTEKLTYAGIGCGAVLGFLLVLAIIGIVNVSALIVGYKNWHDDDPECSSHYSWPLSEWLVIVGSIALVRTAFHLLATIGICGGGVLLDADDKTVTNCFSLVNIIISVLWFFPEFALWIVGCVLLDDVSRTCRIDNRSVYDMSLAFVIIHAIYMVIQIYLTYGLSCGKVKVNPERIQQIVA